MKQPLILAIDTSCDDTSAAVVQERRVLSNIISAQEQLHKKYGGVMPTLAKLEHQQRIDAVIKEALVRAHVQMDDITAIAATNGPGLAIALEVGINKSNQLAIENNKPLIAVNHMEGHLLSALAQNSSGHLSSIDNVGEHNWLGLLISGGHTEFIKVNDIGNYTQVGSTLDDACGEAFDKSARVLGLGYPGGAFLSELARQARPLFTISEFNYKGGLYIRITPLNDSQLQLPKNIDLTLPVPLSYSHDLNMSFSGLKTAFWQLVRTIELADVSGGKINTKHAFDQQRKEGANLNKDTTLALALLFETAAVKQLAIKLEFALQKYQPSHLLLGGGVVNNTYLRRTLRAVCKSHDVKLCIPFSKKLFVDNAAMIGIAAYYKLLRKEFTATQDIDRQPTLELGEKL